LNKGGDIPRDAINIADMLGLPREIINGARKHLGKE
jgi:DNA mismatch repair ATPase MutS